MRILGLVGEDLQQDCRAKKVRNVLLGIEVLCCGMYIQMMRERAQEGRESFPKFEKSFAHALCPNFLYKKKGCGRTMLVSTMVGSLSEKKKTAN